MKATRYGRGRIGFVVVLAAMLGGWAARAIRAYILDNPRRWAEDTENPRRVEIL